MSNKKSTKAVSKSPQLTTIEILCGVEQTDFKLLRLTNDKRPIVGGGAMEGEKREDALMLLC
jgi:hypothetical protein